MFMERTDITPEKIEQLLKGELGEEAQRAAMVHTIEVMVRRAFGIVRVVAGPGVGVSSGPGGHLVRGR